MKLPARRPVAPAGTVAALALVAWSVTTPARAQIMENFNDPNNLLNRGWVKVNNSVNPNIALDKSWGPPIPGTVGTFNPPPSPPDNSYWATDITATNDISTSGVTISDWLMSPVTALTNGTVVSFFTTSHSPEEGPSRMEIRVSTNGSSTNAGTTPDSVGDFTILLRSINPNLDKNVYPVTWTQFTDTLTGLSGPTTGRIAFRYYVTNSGINAPNGDTIALDSVSVNPVPEPATLALTAAALPGLAWAVRRKRKSAE